MSGKRRPSVTSNTKDKQDFLLSQYPQFAETDKFQKEKEDPSRNKRITNDGWGGKGWEGYRHAKVMKLDKQFDNQYSCNEKNRTGIFEGVVIYVNGYTCPSIDELRRLMKEHGGGFQQYYSAALCTHIIATNLPNSKIKEIKNKKVVHPDWIIDSIKAKKKLPLYKYLLYGGERDVSVKIRSHNSKVSQDSSKLITKCYSDYEEAVGDPSSELVADERRTCSLSTARALKEPPTHGLNELVLQNLSLSNRSSENEVENVELIHQAGSLHGNWTNNEATELKFSEKEDDSSSRAAPFLTKHGYSLSKFSGHGTAGNSHFIADFYSNSRLHHLSMWKNELKRFAKIIHQKGRQLKETHAYGSHNKEKVIMHVDLDSFFVSVALKELPHLLGLPIAVCHAGKGNPDYSGNSTFGSFSEIASCSYEARREGVRNGMFLGQALKLCPSLRCVPYFFDQYRSVSQKFYEILASYTSVIEAVSCDEALLDISRLVTTQNSALDIASRLRKEIKEQTGCTASAGIGPNILIAKMATRKAKPNGQCFVTQAEIADFIVTQEVCNLPGVGWSHGKRLKSLNITTCSDLQRLSLSRLQEEFGQKLGEYFFKCSRGEDNRVLKTEQVRKSVSAEINYGIRFEKDSQTWTFLKELAEEVQKRLEEVNMKGRCITLKLMVRKENAANAVKYMGHGICDSLSRSVTIVAPTSDSSVIFKECVNLVKQLKITPGDLRGIGIQVSKLMEGSSGCSTIGNTLERFVKDRAERSELSFSSRGKGGQVATMKDFRGTSTCSGPTEDHKAATGDTQKEDLGRAEIKIIPVTLNEGQSIHCPVKEESTDSRFQLPHDFSCSKSKMNTPLSAKGSPLKVKDRRKTIAQRARAQKMTSLTNVSLSKLGKVRMTPFVARTRRKEGLYSKKGTPSAPGLLTSPSKALGIAPESAQQVGFFNIDLTVFDELPLVVKDRHNERKNKYSQTDRKPNKKVHLVSNSYTTMRADQHLEEAMDDYVNSSSSKIGAQFSSPRHSTGHRCFSPGQVKPTLLPMLPDDVPEEDGEVRHKATETVKMALAKPENRQDTRFGRTGRGQEVHRNSSAFVGIYSTLPNKQLDSAEFLSSSQVDMSVLEQLPPEIRSEVEAMFSKKETERFVRVNPPFPGATHSSSLLPIAAALPGLEVQGVNVAQDQDESCGQFLFHEDSIRPGLPRPLDQSVFLSQIDPSVLDALPWELQQEVHMQFRRGEFRKSWRNRRKESMNVAEEILNRKIGERCKLSYYNTCQEPVPSLAGWSDLDDIIHLLRQWIKSTDEPKPEDIEALSEFLQQLVASHNLETLYLLLRKFRRYLKHQSQCWKMVYNNFLSGIQKNVMCKYGSRLFVEPCKLDTLLTSG